jgi:D-tyrosyl-tRNA(Tyr) deacylase
VKALIQRVRFAKVTVDGRVIGEIGPGYLVLLGVKTGDAEADADYLAQKTLSLRIFPDAEHHMNRSILDSGGSILVVSQFTLYADTRKGNRPGFSRAAPPAIAEPLYRRYADALRRVLGEGRIATGAFGAMMAVELLNDGPVTVELTSDADLTLKHPLGVV